MSFFDDRFVILRSFVLGTLFNSNVSSPAWRMMYSVSRWNVSILAINVKFTEMMNELKAAVKMFWLSCLLEHGVQN